MLAMQAAGSAESADFKDTVMDVANAPGEQIFPGELAKALKILEDGGEIDYVGATAVELIGPGESAGNYRQIEVKGKKLLLNGNSLRLRGFNRHEDHPQFGNALPLEAVANDLERFREMGCNFLRTSHYPNDMRMLDLCDEMGICVWEESHARTVDFKHPMYKEQITKSTVEMLGELAPNRRLAVAREITKLHEETLRGTPAVVLPLLTGKRLKGELVLVLEGRRAAEEA